MERVAWVYKSNGNSGETKKLVFSLQAMGMRELPAITTDGSDGVCSTLRYDFRGTAQRATFSEIATIMHLRATVLPHDDPVMVYQGKSQLLAALQQSIAPVAVSAGRIDRGSTGRGLTLLALGVVDAESQTTRAHAGDAPRFILCNGQASSGARNWANAILCCCGMTGKLARQTLTAEQLKRRCGANGRTHKNNLDRQKKRARTSSSIQ